MSSGFKPKRVSGADLAVQLAGATAHLPAATPPRDEATVPSVHAMVRSVRATVPPKTAKASLSRTIVH